MAVTAVVGANWGDEGKGKITDYLAGRADVVVRFQGGSNAGHTVINEYGKFALHLLPSGVFRQGVINVLGPGVAVDIDELLSELSVLSQRGVPAPSIAISDRAQVMMPHHRLFDECEEDRLGARKFGSTRSGIAPFYSDKYAKIGIQVSMLFDEEMLQSRVEQAVEIKNVLMKHLYGRPPVDAGSLFDWLKQRREMVRPFVADTSKLLRDSLSAGKEVLLEGQLGTLRDPDHGIYPYSTSSSTLAGFGCVGAGIPPYALKTVVAVVKAYSTAVGEGPFVTEISGDAATELRDRGGDAGEYGATTGRPRRVGWFDAVATRYGCAMQGATAVALTNLDVLGYMERIPVCTAYEVDGRATEDFPTTPSLRRAKPVLRELPGWKADISGVRRFEDLPREAQDYVGFVEKETGVPVRYVSVGPERDQTVVR